MSMGLPKTFNKTEHYNNIKCVSFNADFINVYLEKNKEEDFSDLLVILRKFNNETINVHNIYSRNTLNKIIELLSKNKYNGNIIFNLLSKYDVDGYDITYDIDNGRFINIESLPSNVKIVGFPDNNKQTEFTTWAHNLSKNDKLKLLNCLEKSNKELFIKQEKIAVSFYKDVIKVFPNIMNYNSFDRFNIIYKYFKSTYPYAFECLNSNGDGVKIGAEWSQDAIETYERGRGVCEGRANLLTLVTNNPIFNLRCVTVEGKYGQIEHVWNQFIDDNDVVRNYDLSFSIADNVPFYDIEKYNHTYERLYPCVLERVINSKKEIRPLPRRNVLRPLPKDE